MDVIRLPGFEAQLSRKRIKNINVRIDNQGRVKISAPMRCPLISIQEFLQQKQPWIQKHQARLLYTGMKVDPVTVEQKQQMQALVPSLIEKWEKIIGVQIREWVIRPMKTRWGSCNPSKKRICLNLYLMHYPLECLEYVVVHELVHLLEASHNQRFHALMTRFMPNWKEVKSVLKNRA